MRTVQPITEPADEAPDWVNVTPEEPRYDLAMVEPGGDSAQHLDITREEFVMLKRVLASFRGHELLAPMTDFESKDYTNDKVQITQEEIQIVLNIRYASDVMFRNFRQRLKLAPVEPGKWEFAEAFAPEEPGYEEPHDSRDGALGCGLDIHPVTDKRTMTAGVKADNDHD